MDKETVQTLLELLDPLHASLDEQTYDEKVRENFDGPRDREYDVTITAQHERDLAQAVLILEGRLRDAAPRAPAVDPDNLLQFRKRLNVAGEFLCGLTEDLAAREAYTAVLYVQSALLLGAEEMRLDASEEARS